MLHAGGLDERASFPVPVAVLVNRAGAALEALLGTRAASPKPRRVRTDSPAAASLRFAQPLGLRAFVLLLVAAYRKHPWLVAQYLDLISTKHRSALFGIPADGKKCKQAVRVYVDCSFGVAPLGTASLPCNTKVDRKHA